MFTGLIEHIATVSSIQDPSSLTSSSSNDKDGFIMTLSDSAAILDDCHIGDSICLNGACLTVTQFDQDSFQVNLAPETLRRTNLGELKVGDKVNCERAMSATARYGGHSVQGHVDSTAKIISKIPDGDSIRYQFQLEPETTLLPYITEKGYITIDGASLTITNVQEEENSFGIMLIQHSQGKLTLTKKEVGDKVNIEVDITGKYILGSTSKIEAIVDRLLEKKLKERGL
ncbi:riboflavin synthase, alpha subunit [Kwoniella dejecticola CBS 10117]|uniref:Riboflavin synthase n=1 Tax=Kwoniella dejecticola CBS 10117 TaxID=1296121 RepID=A0A1A6AAK4_9TREE|nr:riboflavin synthase, alpha subunit [Kwoniella dejecticola CBS 10117]OBR87097.1 riboflavin synthase, alpha subunit [Kwoniella dejecticola CBS 10117]